MKHSKKPKHADIVAGEVHPSLIRRLKPGNKKRWLILITIFICIAALAGGGYYWYKHTHKPKPPVMTEEQKKQKLKQEIDKLMHDGPYIDPKTIPKTG
jgi:hypothetical protein